MGSEWREVPLSELTDPDTPVTYGVVKPGPEDPDGVLFIRGGDIAGGCVLVDQLRTITREISQQYRRTQLCGGEIVVSLVGNPGQVAIVPESLKGANIARQVGLVRLKDGIDTRFVKYYLSSSMGQEALGAHSLGSVQQVINLRDLKTVPVPLPPLPEQRAIAHILGTLDDKIELNRRMSETLEQMAQALFKSWFVDFDPVVVNALRAGNPLPEKFAERAAHYRENPDALGLPDPILRLFPARFVDSELGEIPEGWEVGTVGSVIKRLPTGKKYEQKTVKLFGSVPVLDQGKSGLIGYHDETPGVIASEESPVAVFANHTCYMRLISFPFSTIQNVLPFIGNKVDTLWAYYATQGKQSFIEYKGHWPDFIRHKIVVSPPALTNEFAHVIRPLIRRVWKLDEESRTLATLRDALLPRLISGQLRVKDAERFLKERGL